MWDTCTVFIGWAKKQVEFYAEMFRKQVYSSDADRQIIEEAIRITQTQSRRVRHEVCVSNPHVVDALVL